MIFFFFLTILGEVLNSSAVLRYSDPIQYQLVARTFGHINEVEIFLMLYSFYLQIVALEAHPIYPLVASLDASGKLVIWYASQLNCDH